MTKGKGKRAPFKIPREVTIRDGAPILRLKVLREVELLRDLLANQEKITERLSNLLAKLEKEMEKEWG